MTEGYSLRDVSKLLGLSRSMVGRLIEAGFVAPARGARREYRFSFQDLVVLRAAQELTAAKISSTKILRALRRLRAQLPEQAPLAGLRIEAVGDAVVVNEGAERWQPENGQYVFSFQVDNANGRLAFIDSVEAPRSTPKTAWFEQGLALEATDIGRACDAYRQAIAAAPEDADAYINLGRLLHERGSLREAEAIYRDGLAHCGVNATLLFNLAVALEDLGRPADAAATYRTALKAAPDMADAHFNLARLCETQGLRQEAVRHLSAFRKLTGGR